MTMSGLTEQCCEREVCTLGRGSGEDGYEHARARTWLLVQVGALQELTEELTPPRAASVLELVHVFFCGFEA